MKGREKRLVRRLKNHDRDAARELVDLFHARMYRYLFLLCRNRPLAEDLVQETFWTVWSSIDSFRFRSSLSTWIHSIARNHFLQQLRRKLPTEGSPPVPLLDPPDAPEARPEGIYLRAETEEKLWQEVQRLVPEQCEVILLHYIQDLSIRAASRVLGVPVGTVKSRLSAALRELRQSFQKGERSYEPQKV